MNSATQPSNMNLVDENEVEVDLRLTVSQLSWCWLPSGAHDQIFVFCLTTVGFLMWGTLSDERMGL
jgi:hypothetical protein